MALGFGSLYNHIAPSNADYEMDFDEQTIKIFAVCDIPAGTEIMINYNGDPEDATPPWFMETKEEE
jgi:SET domain-containing protein